MCFLLYSIYTKTIGDIMQNKNKTLNIILCSFFAALTGIFAQIIIPLPFTPMPISLANLCVIFSGLILGARMGAISQIVYLLVGAVGLPVFARMQGGFSVLFGESGGFLLSYPIIALIAGLIVEKVGFSRKTCLLAGATASFICYITGSLWFMLISHTTLAVAIIKCILPFLIGDALKTAFIAAFAPSICLSLADKIQK
jgi:biotin transport system substrate-specific component